MFVENPTFFGYENSKIVNDPTNDHYIQSAIFWGWAPIYMDDSRGPSYKSVLFNKYGCRVLLFTVEMEDRYFFVYDREEVKKIKVEGNNFRQFLEENS